MCARFFVVEQLHAASHTGGYVSVPFTEASYELSEYFLNFSSSTSHGFLAQISSWIRFHPCCHQRSHFLFCRHADEWSHQFSMIICLRSSSLARTHSRLHTYRHGAHIKRHAFAPCAVRWDSLRRSNKPWLQRSGLLSVSSMYCMPCVCLSICAPATPGEE